MRMLKMNSCLQTTKTCATYWESALCIWAQMTRRSDSPLVCNVVYAMLCMQCCVCSVVYAVLCMQCCVCNVVYAVLCMQCCVCSVVYAMLCMQCCVCSVVYAMWFPRSSSTSLLLRQCCFLYCHPCTYPRTHTPIYIPPSTYPHTYTHRYRAHYQGQARSGGGGNTGQGENGAPQTCALYEIWRRNQLGGVRMHFLFGIWKNEHALFLSFFFGMNFLV